MSVLQAQVKPISLLKNNPNTEGKTLFLTPKHLKSKFIEEYQSDFRNEKNNVEFLTWSDILKMAYPNQNEVTEKDFNDWLVSLILERKKNKLDIQSINR